MTTVPDFAETRYAFRTWGLDDAAGLLRSLNSPQKKTWVGTALASPEGCWPVSEVLRATCRVFQDAKKGKDHGPLPAPDCTCGIYATSSLSIVNNYLRDDSPVLGIVELGARTIPATQGYRALTARIAAILLIDTALTLPHERLKAIAATYRVPAIVPHSYSAEDYRDLIAAASLGDEAEAFLRKQGGTR